MSSAYDLQVFAVAVLSFVSFAGYAVYFSPNHHAKEIGGPHE